MWYQSGFLTVSGLNGPFTQLSSGLCSLEPLVFSILTKGQWSCKNRLKKKKGSIILKAKVFSDYCFFFLLIKHRPECFCASKGLEHSYWADRKCTKVEKGGCSFKSHNHGPPALQWTSSGTLGSSPVSEGQGLLERPLLLFSSISRQHNPTASHWEPKSGKATLSCVHPALTH